MSLGGASVIAGAGLWPRHGAAPGNRFAAGRFWPIAALLVGHYALTWLPPRALRCAKIGSVTAAPPKDIWLLCSPA